jgi:hypothetical protein
MILFGTVNVKNSCYLRCYVIYFCDFAFIPIDRFSILMQILLDIVDLFNMVSSLSKKKQSIKITHEGIEVSLWVYH